MKKRRLTKKELNFFKDLILKKKEAILEEIKHISDDALKLSQRDASGDISTYTFHMADVATDTYDREFSLDLAFNEHRILYEIDDVLKKIEEGSYGDCEDCQRPISKVRLRAIPYARLCLKCQRLREKKR